MRTKIALTLLTVCVATSCNRVDNRPQYEIVEETYVHKYDVIVPENDWVVRGQDGKVISTLSNGVVVTKNFSNGILEGESFYTYPHSDVVEKVETYDNNLLKKEVAYSPSGIPSQETLFLEDGTKDVTTWYENGSPQCIELYDAGDLLVKGQYFDMRHQLDDEVKDGVGIRVIRDMYGQLQSREEIKNGEIVSRTTYHPMGTPDAVTFIRNGVAHGQCRTYLPAGEPNTIEEWIDGQQEGISIQYQNGEKYAEVPYVNGMRNGLERHYRDGKDVVEEISWKNDVLHGPTTTYVGGTKQMDWYYQGKPITRANFENLNGILAP